MEIKLMPKIGFCYGVERSINLTKKLLNSNYPKPYYITGMLVHNSIVNDELKSLGYQIIDIENIDFYLNDQLPKTFISTAHGINDINKNKIINNGAYLIDTTCPIVKKNNEKVLNYYNNGYDIIYIGKKNHQESNVIKNYVHLVENIDDLNNLNIVNKNIVLMNQTTVSIIEIEFFTNEVLKKYSSCKIDTLICPATKERQDILLKEVKKHHSNNDLWLIIGDKLSNNTKKLKEIVDRYTKKYYFIDSLDIIEKIPFSENDTIYITSGTSTPNSFIDEVVNLIKKSHH